MHYPENKSAEDLFHKIEESFESKLPFVVYRKPQENKLTAVFQQTDHLHFVKDFTERGFVFAPFVSKDDLVLIQPDSVLEIEAAFENKLESSSISPKLDDEEAHVQLVEKGIQEIQKGNLKKVVLSRKIEVEVSKDPTTIFKSLLGKYSNAFCYLFHHPKVGTWCGATPETLVKLKQNELFTVSLAATLPFQENVEPKWGSKEVEEQQMVSDYINGQLTPFMDQLDISKAKSVRAGNLWHLQSEVKGTLSSNVVLKEVISALHPTPAVCGIPTKEAQKFILENENYQRSYYTGFLGEINLKASKEVSLYVNLRCMEFKDSIASIFVGGGITGASNPKLEWEETQNKSKTMLNIL
ncbi:chorismate-binding protein [Flagellimonas zhangzhouensis]|uniref:isochorismate synthase n=1 Tax=Flagellimonas zhangzhouensis TaxID=1073328 RepID=A0A1H2SVU2_9FLAO|nr:chorismate-binding protein [Allomuricauda zhangzhouensis]SDQ80036.1 isochorismate synthase [Allomuricauda zhangzhouensis]SDW35595.1 isochorismate synthase [Allomuricauda zhangzhouensis]